MYDPELFCLYFYVAVGRAAVRPELPLYPDHVVVSPPDCPDRVVVDRLHYAREVWAPAPLHRTGVAPSLWVTLGWASEAIFFDCQDISPHVDEQILVSLKLLVLLFQAPCSGY